MDVQDSVNEVKIKITLVYEHLDPDKFRLIFNNRILHDQEKIINLMKENNGNEELTFTI